MCLQINLDIQLIFYFELLIFYRVIKHIKTIT